MATVCLQRLKTCVLQSARKYRAISHHANLFTTISQIEVERKFLPTSQLRTLLGVELGDVKQGSAGMTGGDGEAALNPTRLPSKWIRDIYYDLDDKLSSKGIWVRRRMVAGTNDSLNTASSIKLEAKIRLGGDYSRSQFHEIEGESNIASYVESQLGIAVKNLVVLVDLKTYRQAWALRNEGEKTLGGRRPESDVNDGFTLVLDEVALGTSDEERIVPFKHLIGEVEITRTVTGGSDETQHEYLRQRSAKQADSLIEAFMTRHRNLFSTDPKPVGKLAAYFAWTKRVQS